MFSTIISITTTAINLATQTINDQLEDRTPSELITATVLIITIPVFTMKAYQIYRHWNTQEVKDAFIEGGLSVLKKTPYIGTALNKFIEDEVRKGVAGLKDEIDRAREGITIYDELPEESLTHDEVRHRFKDIDAHHKKGHLSGSVYAEPDEKMLQLLKDIYGLTSFTNPLHSDWPLIPLLEAETISMAQVLFNGTKGAPGIITHGGTTSILEACKAYVLYARDNGNNAPEIIAPTTAHFAFDKSHKMLNAKIIWVPVDPKTGKADVKKMENAITKYTCLMIGSAPSFPFGVYDPIEALAAIALKHKIPFHVDACLGGFLNAFAHEAGFQIPRCDFSIPGITSMSADTHKYGETPKGSSVLLFHPDCKASTAYVSFDSACGMYVTEGTDGSRSGAIIATTWATLMIHGKKYYIEETRRILSLSKGLTEAIKKIDGIDIPFEPELSVIGMQAKAPLNTLLIASKLNEAGWTVNVVKTPTGKPAFHFCLTAVHTMNPNFIDAFTQGLNNAVQYARAHPNEKPHGLAKAYGSLHEPWYPIPKSIKRDIGRGFVAVSNTLPGIKIPGIWSPPPIRESRLEIISEGKLTKQ